MLIAVFQPWNSKLNTTNWQSVTVYGIAIAGMNLMFYMSLKTIALGIAVALEFTGPLAVAMLSSRRPIDFAWIVLAVIGLWLLLIGASAHALDRSGVAFALGAGFCWALYIVSGQRAGAEHGAHATVFGMVIASIVVAPIGAEHAGSLLLSRAVLPLALAVAILWSDPTRSWTLDKRINA